MSPKILTLSLTGILGAGIVSTTVAFYQTKVIMWDLVSEDALPIGGGYLNKIWEKLENKLSEKEDLQDKKLNSIKKLSDSKGTKLKAWCLQSYKKTYWSWLQKEDIDLKKDVEKACIWKIGDQLDSTKKLSIEKNEDYKKNYLSKIKKLKDHQRSVPLDQDLEKIQNTEEENAWEMLRDWCGKTYERGFQSTKFQRWQLANLYCTKDNN